MQLEQIDINKDNYHDITASNKGLLIIMFRAQWSQPSKNLDIPLREIKDKYIDRIKIAIFDAEDNEGFLSRLGIISIPTILFYCDNRLVKTLEGYYDLDELSSHIDQYI